MEPPTLADLLGAYGVEYLVTRGRWGGGIRELTQWASENWPAARATTINAVASRAWEARRAAARFSTLAPGERLRASDLRPPDTGCLRWRYQVGYTVVDQDTGKTLHINDNVTVGRSLNADELRDEATAYLANYSDPRRGKISPDKAVPRRHALIGVQIYGVQRVC